MANELHSIMTFSTMLRGALAVACSLVLASCDASSNTDEPAGAGDFSVQSGTVTLETTLVLPSSAGPHPTLVIIPGSDNTPYDRAEPLVALFAGQGFAILQYNKRGVGASTGSHPLPATVEEEEAFYQDRAQDVNAILDFLATHRDIDASRMGVWGSSQGGWVASVVASATNNARFLIAASGGASPTGVENYYDAMADDLSLSIDELNDRIAAYDGPLRFDPRPFIRQLTIPSLWIYGEKDRSNPTANDISELEKIRSETRQDITIQSYPDANHDLVDETTGDLPADLVPNVLAWLKSKTQNGEAGRTTQGLP